MQVGYILRYTGHIILHSEVSVRSGIGDGGGGDPEDGGGDDGDSDGDHAPRYVQTLD